MYELFILTTSLYLIYLLTYYLTVFIIHYVLKLCIDYNFDFNSVLKHMIIHHLKSYICYILLILITHMIIPIKIIVENDLNLISFITKSLFLIIAFDFVYFVFHFLFHYYPFLYKNIHKTHHHYQCEHPLIAHYTSIIELVILNLYSLIILLILFQFTFVECIIVTIIGTSKSCLVHSNINKRDNGHDKHHKYLNCNYSLFGICDKLFNTCYIENDSNKKII